MNDTWRRADRARGRQCSLETREGSCRSPLSRWPLTRVAVCVPARVCECACVCVWCVCTPLCGRVCVSECVCACMYRVSLCPCAAVCVCVPCVNAHACVCLAHVCSCVPKCTKCVRPCTCAWAGVCMCTHTPQLPRDSCRDGTPCPSPAPAPSPSHNLEKDPSGGKPPSVSPSAKLPLAHSGSVPPTPTPTPPRAPVSTSLCALHFPLGGRKRLCPDLRSL